MGATGDEGLDEDEGGEEYKDGGGGGEEDEDGEGDGEGEGEGAAPELEIPNCVVYWYCPVASTINWIP